jgi:oligoribonuclease NrnB/cAMP/cGMP phosphodiesterase (DHH superfamily)
MASKDYYIFTDCDLDGAGSYIVFGWLSGMTDIPYMVCRVNDLEKKLKGWLKTHKFSDYKKVYFFDLDVSTEGIKKLIDHDNVIVIDHHESNIESDVVFNKANMIVEDTTSTCKLIYKNFKDNKLSKELTKEQKLFIYMVDDYDSYTLKLEESKKLNDVFWSYQGNRVEKLERDFSTGFTGFNRFHENTLIIKEKDLAKMKLECEMFTGEIKTKKATYKVGSIIGNKYINELADYVSETTGSDVALVVNPSSGKVSFRKRNDEVELSMVKLADMVTDDSGGHDAAAGGMICDKFLEFTKRLSPFTS